MEEYGQKKLRHFLTIEKNVQTIEKYISLKSKGNSELYNILLFEVLMSLKNNVKLIDILNQIKTDKLGWNHESFSELKTKQMEQDDFLTNPFEVEEGVLTCQRCNGKRTFSYQKQTRSADEPMTTFAQCMNCKHKWQYSG